MWCTYYILLKFFYLNAFYTMESQSTAMWAVCIAKTIRAVCVAKVLRAVCSAKRNSYLCFLCRGTFSRRGLIVEVLISWSCRNKRWALIRTLSLLHASLSPNSFLFQPSFSGELCSAVSRWVEVVPEQALLLKIEDLLRKAPSFWSIYGINWK